MSLASPHTVRVMRLYRKALKTALSWAGDRDVFWDEADRLRAEFDANKHVTERRQLESLVRRGEKKLWQHAHCDPYIVPYRPGGSLYARNPPFPPVHRQPDFGREADTFAATMAQGQ